MFLSTRWPLYRHTMHISCFCDYFLSWELIHCTYVRVFMSFQFKTLICMCEMCCSGVKCSAVPSRMKTTTHPLLSVKEGRLGGEGEKQENRKEKEGERVTDAPVHLTESRNSTLSMATLSGILILPSQIVLSLTLQSTFFIFKIFLCSSFVLLSVHYR